MNKNCKELEKQRLEEKFRDVPLEDDTHILHYYFLKVGEFDAKFEFWIWESFAGGCLIFLKEDIAALSREELTEMIKEHLDRDDVQLSEVNSKYLFANYDTRDYSQ